MLAENSLAHLWNTCLVMITTGQPNPGTVLTKSSLLWRTYQLQFERRENITRTNAMGCSGNNQPIAIFFTSQDGLTFEVRTLKNRIRQNPRVRASGSLLEESIGGLLRGLQPVLQLEGLSLLLHGGVSCKASYQILFRTASPSSLCF
jgi:hypothetical protein